MVTIEANGPVVFWTKAGAMVVNVVGDGEVVVGRTGRIDLNSGYVTLGKASDAVRVNWEGPLIAVLVTGDGTVTVPMGDGSDWVCKPATEEFSHA